MERLPKRITLQPGQALQLCGAAGMRIVAVSGQVRIVGPFTMLGEQMIRPAFILQTGQAHAIVDPGWISMSAQTSVELLCIVDEPARPLRQLLSAAIRFARRRIATQAGA